jgi:hypothetical protein
MAASSRARREHDRPGGPLAQRERVCQQQSLHHESESGNGGPSTTVPRQSTDARRRSLRSLATALQTMN